MPSQQSLTFIREKNNSKTEVSLNPGESIRLGPGETLVFPEGFDQSSVYFTVKDKDLTIKTSTGETYTIDNFFERNGDSPSSIRFSSDESSMSSQQFNTALEHIFGPLIFQMQTTSLTGPGGLDFSLSSSGIYQSFIRTLGGGELTQFDGRSPDTPGFTQQQRPVEFSPNNLGNEQFLQQDTVFAGNDNFTIEDNAILIGTSIFANDSSTLGLPLQATITQQPTQGTLTLGPNGTFLYVPNENALGTDGFSYQLTSSANTSTDIGRVNITITPSNDAPVANDDTVALDEDTATKIAVLTNDTDLDGDTLVVDGFTQGANGTVMQLTPEVISYAPNADFFGTDTFTYIISDGNGGTDEATVTVTINPVNDAPVANDDTIVLDEDAILRIQPLGNDTDVDNDPLTITSFTQPQNGFVFLEQNIIRKGDMVRDDPGEGDELFGRGGFFVINPPGTLSYEPSSNFFGTDSFTYTISDGNGGTDIGTVSLTVNPVNDPPSAVTDSVFLDEDTSAQFTILDNDFDVENDPISLVDFNQPDNGTVTVNQDGSFTYEPAADFFGNDSFTYTIQDDKGGTNIGTVLFTVNSVNDTPTAVDDTFTLDEDTSVVLDILSNDIDPDMEQLFVLSLGFPMNGRIELDNSSPNPLASAVYTPNPDFSGIDSLTYRVGDGVNSFDDGMVFFNVTPINDAPEITPGTPNSFLPFFTSGLIFPESLTLTDVDDTHLEGATIQLIGGDGESMDDDGGGLPWMLDMMGLGGESLAATAVGNITVNYDPMTRVLTLSGTDTVANYQSVLDSVVYIPDFFAFPSEPRSFVVTVDDGEATDTTTVALLREGFELNSEPYDRFVSVTAGDINGDGFDDTVIGVVSPSYGDVSMAYTGKTSVFYGKAYDSVGSYNISVIDMFAGFGVNQNGDQPFDYLGASTSVGDFNGDGFDDIAAGAPGVDVDEDTYNEGRVFVTFGEAMPSSSDVSDLLQTQGGDGSAGFTVDGTRNEHNLGYATAFGDINGDGLADVLSGDPEFDQYSMDRSIVSVAFGQQTIVSGDATITQTELTGNKGFTIFGEAGRDLFGLSLTGSGMLGDVNGDGIDDALIGAPETDSGERDDDTGAAYLVFGGQDFTNDIDATTFAAGNGSQGVFLPGVSPEDEFGSATSTGSDINGDGFNDLFIGAPKVNNGDLDQGALYVVFGRDGFTQQFDVTSLLPKAGGDGSQGFIITGLGYNDNLGYQGSIATGGDFNGDGIDDLVVTAFLADRNGLFDVGDAYLIFGRDQGFEPVIDLAQLDATQGLRFSGSNSGDILFAADISGDLNGDGFDDLLLLRPSANGYAGNVEIVYGQDVNNTAEKGTDMDDSLIGTSGADILIGQRGNDLLIGAGGNDVLLGGSGDDDLLITDDTFKRLDGDSGEDSVTLVGDNFTLDLTQIADNRVQNIEAFDLSDAGSQTLNIDVRDLLNGSESDNQWMIIGGAEDVFNADLSGHGFSNAGSSMAGFTDYSNGIASLSVDDDIADNIIL